VASGPVQGGGIIHAYRETNMNGFVQDDWRVSSRLTLNLGVRWEYDGTFSEKYGNLTNTWISQLAPNSQVPTAPVGLQANYAGWVTAGNYLDHYPQPPAGVLVNKSGTGAIREHPPLSNFAPRFGFAYQAAERLVIRGGAGVFYDRIGADRFVHAVEQGNPYSTTLDYSGAAAAPFTIQNPFPNLPPGQFVQRWANPTTLTSSNLSVPFINEVSHTPLIRQYNLNFQYEFAPRWVLEAVMSVPVASTCWITITTSTLPAWRAPLIPLTDSLLRPLPMRLSAYLSSATLRLVCRPRHMMVFPTTIACRSQSESNSPVD